MVLGDRWRGMVLRHRRRLSTRQTVERADKANDAGNYATEERQENELVSM
jgi:hypothetical protein